MFKSEIVRAVPMTDPKEKLEVISPSAPSKLPKIPPSWLRSPVAVSSSQSRSPPTVIPMAAAKATKKPALVADQMSIDLSLSLICLRGSDEELAVRLNILAN